MYCYADCHPKQDVFENGQNDEKLNFYKSVLKKKMQHHGDFIK